MVRNPAWSPDGSWLVFESDVASFRDLYRVGRDGSALERLTNQPHGSFEPSVAPDGQIAFASSRDSNAELYTMGAHGAQPRRLTRHPADDVRPRWSPDGSTIAWISSRQGGPAVWTMRPDGSAAHRLTTLGSGQDVDLAWSPVGDKLAVITRSGSADLDLRVVTLATGSVQLLGDKGVAEQPAWAPDGSAVAFTLSREGVSQVMVAPMSGGAPWVACPDDCWLPRWLPAP